MKSKFLKISVFFLPLIISVSSCSDLRKAIGKEKVIPDEYSVMTTPSLLIPPGYNIDPKTFKNKNLIDQKKDFSLSEKIIINNSNKVSSFKELFLSKDIPKNIRKIVDEETLGISLSERTGFQILFGDIPESGVIIDSKKEAIRLRNNKSSGKKLNANPSPAIDKNTRKPMLIK
ncbi:DUF3035 domain-containing protein [Alphaproteobacteria bacterium]|nr:DUF3035 domain-containing protein [Alphaproteobacteria bacterium]